MAIGPMHRGQYNGIGGHHNASPVFRSYYSYIFFFNLLFLNVLRDKLWSSVVTVFWYKERDDIYT